MDNPGEEKKPGDGEFREVITRYPDYNAVFSLARDKARNKSARLIRRLRNMLSGLR